MKYLKLFFFSFCLLIAFLPACKDKTPEPYKVNDLTMEQLRACAKMTTTIVVDSCEYIASPYFGATVGIDFKHKELCKNPKHAK